MTQPFVGHDYIDSWLHRREADRLLAPWDRVNYSWSAFIHSSSPASPSETAGEREGRSARNPAPSVQSERRVP